MQEKVSRAIIDSLKLTLTPEEEESLAERPIDDVRAYECYLKARREVMLFTKDGLDRAREHLQEALVLGKADAVLAASIFHYRRYTIGRAKEYLREKGIPVRSGVPIR